MVDPVGHNTDAVDNIIVYNAPITCFKKKNLNLETYRDVDSIFIEVVENTVAGDEPKYL